MTVHAEGHNGTCTKCGRERNDAQGCDHPTHQSQSAPPQRLSLGDTCTPPPQTCAQCGTFTRLDEHFCASSAIAVHRAAPAPETTTPLEQSDPILPTYPNQQTCRCGSPGTRNFRHFGGAIEWRCDACPMPRPIPPHTPGRPVYSANTVSPANSPAPPRPCADHCGRPAADLCVECVEANYQGEHPDCLACCPLPPRSPSVPATELTASEWMDRAIDANFPEKALALLDFIRRRCRVVFYPPDGSYPIEHTMTAQKDSWHELQLAARSQTPTPETNGR